MFLFPRLLLLSVHVALRRQQQFDQFDQVEEERAAAQSRASNEDVNLVRLGSGRAARSKGFGVSSKVGSGAGGVLSVPLE